MGQKIIEGLGCSKKIVDVLNDLRISKFLLVCESSYQYLANRDVIEAISIPHVKFSDFTPNPLYEQVCAGVEMFNSNACDAIVAVGGGSTIDVAKCIKLYCKMDAAKLYLEQPMADTGIPLIAVPTTAGTGSESTRHAVIYYDGKKQSISHEAIVPDYVILDAMVLKTLPLYQKKCTMLDALSQAIESWWSVNSTEESIGFSRNAIDLIMSNWREYIESNTGTSAEQIMLAANYAGRAINITATTAAHAMSYKLTSMYHLPHGHAVAVCLPHVWRYMNEHLDKCIDARGTVYLAGTLEAISREMGCGSSAEAVEVFQSLLCTLEIQNPQRQSDTDIDTLTASVNPVRLKNNPVMLNSDTLRLLYEKILMGILSEKHS